jgi:hypothetical protein
MTAMARARCLCAVVFLSIAAPAMADPLADLLPPPVRPLQKRTLGTTGADDREMMMYRMRGNGGRPGASFSPDGRFLAVSSMYGGLHLWDAAAARHLGPIGSGDGGAMTVAIAPDGRHVVTIGWGGGRGETCPVTLWDMVKREKVRSLDEDANSTAFFAAAFSPDGKTLTLAAGFNRRGGNPTGIHLWDVATGDEIRRLDGVIPADGGRVPPIQALAYSPDGRNLAVLTDANLYVVELATTKVRTQFSVGKPSNNDDQRVMMMRAMRGIDFPAVGGGAVAFSPDGRLLAVAGSEGIVRRFEWPGLRELPPLAGHSGSVLALGFTPDGKRLMSFGSDQKLFIWAADSQRDWRSKSITADDQLLERLWEALNTDDAVDLFGCIRAFASFPGPAVAFFRQRLAPVPKGDTERIDKLVADLQKDDYNARKKAMVELRKIGAIALPALRQAAERDNDGIVRRLLFEMESQSSAARDEVRALHALTVLEHLNTDDARKLLDELSKGAPAATFTVEAKAALDRSIKHVGGSGAAPKLEALWESLHGDDSVGAFHAARHLAERSDALPFLNERLRALAASDAFDNDPKRVAKFIADLDSEEFEVRDRASKGLKTLGRFAEPALKKALEANPGAEVKRQMEEILGEIGRQAQSAEVLRVNRALETLEWIGTPESRRVRETLAKEARGQWLRDAATASLRR